MYYHTRSIKYVIYDKVLPAPESVFDGWEEFLKAYKWLGIYCKYCPQIWLSRSKSSITGYKNNQKFPKKRKYVIGKKPDEDYIMFGFENIIGFPVDYNLWEMILSPLMSSKDPIKDGNKDIEKYMNEILEDYKTEKIEITRDDYGVYEWKECNCNIDYFLKNKLFIEKDQVVLPSLNLKSAKIIYCRNEKQVKKLRNMGFIQDRIKILNSKNFV